MGETTREIPYSDLDIGAVRRYANARANESSVRQIAREVGMRHTTLTKFLNGSEPLPRIRILLIEWYLREQPEHPAHELLSVLLPPSPETPEAHLDALLADVPDGARLEARLRITTALSQAYRRLGLPDPEWLYKTR